MMTERENLITALEGGKPDHVPCFWVGGQLMISTAIGNIPPLGQKEGYDWWGVHWTATEDTGGMFTPTAGRKPIITDITKWREQVKFPDISGIDWEAHAKHDLQMVDPDKVTNFYGLGNGIFERIHFLMGFEEAMCAIIEEPEEVAALADAIADLYVEIIKKVGEYYKPDYFTVLDDYSHQRGTFVSGDMFDEIFAGPLKKLVDACEGNGMKYIQHCCGKMETLVDNMKAIGIHRFDPVQPCNDVVALIKKHPDCSFMGGMDLLGIIDNPYSTPDDLRAETRRCINEYGQDGRYILYCCSVSMYNPAEFAPDKKLGIVIGESLK